MCREMEQIYSEGIESGELKKAKASALSMAADGMKVDKIAHYLNVSVQMVQKCTEMDWLANIYLLI